MRHYFARINVFICTLHLTAYTSWADRHVQNLECVIYLIATLRPAASRSLTAASASSLEIPSLTAFGKPVMNSLASLSPTPVIPRIALSAATRLESSTPSRTTSKESFASSAGAAPPAAAPGAIIIIPPPAAAEASTPKVVSISLTSWEASRSDIVLSFSTISETTGDTSLDPSPSNTRMLRRLRATLCTCIGLNPVIDVLERTPAGLAKELLPKANRQIAATSDTLTSAERPRVKEWFMVGCLS
mmetsp:Transcript_19031/g.28461  ORF Transcript_19031/g.28461 Transcript_19031/m.28461 type:complete len:245 (-) Transcript_19031:25-759(-)